MKNKLNKLYYCFIETDYSGGVWECISDTEKSFKLKRLDDDGGRSYFEAGDIIFQKKDNNCKHTWRDHGEWFVIYPNMSGIPYLFEPLTREVLENEIAHCKRCMVSSAFYRELLKDL